MSVENIKKFSNKLGATMNFIVGETIEIMKDENIKDEAKKMNINQMGDGIDSKGVSLGEYSYHSKIDREKRGKFVDHIILRDTGTFRESIYVKADQLDAQTPAMTFGALDPKWKEKIEPQERFEDALGLTDDNSDIIGGIIARELSQRLSKFWKI